MNLSSRCRDLFSGAAITRTTGILRPFFRLFTTRRGRVRVYVAHAPLWNENFNWNGDRCVRFRVIDRFHLRGDRWHRFDAVAPCASWIWFENGRVGRNCGAVRGERVRAGEVSYIHSSIHRGVNYCNEVTLDPWKRVKIHNRSLHGVNKQRECYVIDLPFMWMCTTSIQPHLA